MIQSSALSLLVQQMESGRARLIQGGSLGEVVAGMVPVVAEHGGGDLEGPLRPITSLLPPPGSEPPSSLSRETLADALRKSADNLRSLLCGTSLGSPRPRPPKGQEVILVADDEHALLKTMKRVLLREGYQVLTAATEEEILGVLDSWYEDPRRPPIQILLMDLFLPGPKTKQLIASLRACEPGMGCLFMSGVLYLPDSYHGIERSSFLPKPMRTEDLNACIRELIEEPITSKGPPSCG